MSKTTSLMAAAIAIIAFPAITRADDTQLNSAKLGRHPAQLSFGGYFPTSSNAQQFVHTAYTVETSYDLGNGSVSLYSGYAWGAHSPVSGVGVNYHDWRIGLQARTVTPTYAGVGVGYYDQSATVSSSGGAARVNHGGVGGTVFIGREFGQRPHQAQKSSGLGVRLGYSFLPNFQGINTDGAEVRLTYRF